MYAENLPSPAAAERLAGETTTRAAAEKSTFIVEILPIFLTMGSCQSKHVPGEDGEDPRAPDLRDVGPEFAASIETPTTLWDREPRIVLFNRSSYSVSYWVVQEDKKRTTQHLETIVNSIGLHLNASLSDVGLSGDLERRSEETTHTEVGVYYLIKDYRMGPRGQTESTRVPFPAACEDVRVYGFFRDGMEWRPFKDKVYSISRKDKIFQLTASTPNITPYARASPTPQLAKTPGETQKRTPGW